MFSNMGMSVHIGTYAYVYSCVKPCNAQDFLNALLHIQKVCILIKRCFRDHLNVKWYKMFNGMTAMVNYSTIVTII